MKINTIVGIVVLFFATAAIANGEVVPQVELAQATLYSSSATTTEPLKKVKVGQYFIEQDSLHNVSIVWKSDFGAPPWIFFDIKSHANESRAVYPFAEAGTTDMSTSSAKIIGLSPGKSYYFRIANNRNPNVFNYPEFSFTLAYPLETPCKFLSTPLGMGKLNPIIDLVKLQQFLRYREFLEVDVNGSFDDITYAAVIAYQERYKSDILSPWNLDKGTGYVYITTLNKINSSFCGREISLTAADRELIAAALTTVTDTPLLPTPPLSRPVLNGEIEPLPELDITPDISVTPPPVTVSTTSTTTKRANPITSFFRRLFGRKPATATSTNATSTRR